MVFSSLEFIYIFLPLFFLCYFFVPHSFKNLILLLGSIVFYAVGSIEYPAHLALLFLAVGIDFYAAIAMEKHENLKKPIMTGVIVYHLVWLFVFKYLGFVEGQFNHLLGLFGSEFSFEFAKNIVLPAGISFYTFQGLSYVIDVYRGKYPAEKVFLRMATYISMFPQLIAGPIVTYPEVRKHMAKRRHTLKLIIEGTEIFIFGLGMKVLLANTIGGLWTEVAAVGYDSISTPLAWVAIFAFTFQIYFDFYGYSLMAIGLGKVMGFSFPKNFDHPYTSRSMTEFWRRWHMTLGSWFREYVYIPLGGNRGGERATYRNLLIVWLLTGIWHGAGYSFLFWGLFIYILIALEKKYYLTYLEKIPGIGHLYMLVVIPVSWVFFSITDISEIWTFLGKMFPIFGNAAGTVANDYVSYLKNYSIVLLAGALFSTKVPYILLRKIKNKKIIWAFLAVILAASTYWLWLGMNNPFLYFRF